MARTVSWRASALFAVVGMLATGTNAALATPRDAGDLRWSTTVVEGRLELHAANVPFDEEPEPATTGPAAMLQRWVEERGGFLATPGLSQGGEVAPGASSSSVDFESPHVVGDFTLDGLPDVAAFAFIEGDEGYSVEVRGRRGTDGAHLWTASMLGGTGGYRALVPMRTGTAGEDGLLLMYWDWDTGTRLFAALDREGQQLWQMELPHQRDGILATSSLVGVEILDALPGEAEDLVVFYEEGGLLTSEVVNGATGVRQPWTALGLAVQPQDFDIVRRVGDATGDGFDDLIVIASDWDTATATATLLDGRTGLQRWQSAPLTYRDYVEAWGAGDVTGDGFGDIVVMTAAYHGGPLTSTLVDGATGVPLWVSDGSLAFGYEDIDGDGVNEVGRFGFELLTDRVEGTFEIVTGIGTVVRSWQQGLDIDDSTGLSGVLDIAGDVDDDGLTDLVLYLSTYSYSTREAQEIHGPWTAADGKIAWQVPDGDWGLLEPLDDTVDGQGADFSLTQFPDSVGVFDGETGERYWLQEPPVRGPYFLFDVADLDGDGLAEMLVEGQPPWVIHGRDATLAW